MEDVRVSRKHLRRNDVRPYCPGLGDATVEIDLETQRTVSKIISSEKLYYNLWKF